MEGKKYHFRTGVFLLLTLLVMASLVVLLYYYQITVGVDEETTTEIYTYTTEESIPAARGSIYSKDGVLLIGNSTEYRVTLDFTDVSSMDTQVYVVRRLIQLCQEYGVEFNDNELPISDTQPYIFTADEGEVYSFVDDETGVTTQTRLGKMCAAMGWEETSSATELLEQMKETFGITGVEKVSDRSFLSVLYSCYLRQEEVLWTTYYFASGVDIGFISVIKEENLPGVEVETAAVREYESTYAAHLLGKVGLITAENWESGENYKAQGYSMDATVGLSGVEYAFESYLQGTEGTKELTWDADGDVIDEVVTAAAVAGDDVTLTINMELQEAVEDALEKYVPKLNDGTGGAAAVVIDVNSGAILSCASWPTYDITDMSYDESRESLSPLFNRALQGTYSPGSTYKMVTATAGLETGVITPYSEIEDTGVIDYYGTEFRCWLYRESGATHGMENVSDALRDSCNIFFYRVGIDVGIDVLTEYAQAYGLGVSSGIELTEATGANAGPEYSEKAGTSWYAGNTLAAAIGQSDNTFTPLQIANYVATLVNGGTRYAAHLLDSYTAADGTVTYYEPQVLNQVGLSASSLEAIKEGMLEVVNSTSAIRSAFYMLNASGIEVGAKTGSAQVTGQENANGLFVCFAPYDDPEIAVCVVVEKGGSGAATSVIAASIMESYFSISHNDAFDEEAIAHGGAAAAANEDTADLTEESTEDGDTAADEQQIDENNEEDGNPDADTVESEAGQQTDTVDFSH